MYAKENIIKDILLDLNSILLTVLSAQNGPKPPMPYAELNIIAEPLENEWEELKITSNVNSVDKEYSNNVILTLSITHHSKDNLDDGINQLRDYFRYMSDLESKYSMSVVNITSTSNRNTILSAEFDNTKGFDVDIRIDDKFIKNIPFIETVESIEEE